jgi:hypothetical protein
MTELLLMDCKLLSSIALGNTVSHTAMNLAEDSERLSL